VTHVIAVLTPDGILFSSTDAVIATEGASHGRGRERTVVTEPPQK
jgi:hypothetical protein